MIAVLVVYASVKRYPFIVLDDLVYIKWNAPLHQLNWETVRWSFTSFHASNWQPLTWLSHALDYHFYLINAGGHHQTNMLLHAVNAVLLFWVLSQATGYIGRSCMVAGLFALHPINVESVAWVAERKNLLSMLFFLLALGAYSWYARRPRIDRYLLVAALFALGLMSKSQVITLPFVLLLWDYWPLGRMFNAGPPSPLARPGGAAPHKSFTWLVAEKLPLLALSAASAVLTVKAQTQDEANAMIGALNSFSFVSRVSNAFLAYVRYLGKAVWPTDLAFFYPHARSSPPAWQIIGAVLFLAAITVLVVLKRKRRYLLVGWFWFLGTLVPMIGLVQVGSQAMADRYAYLPFIGLFIAASWGLAQWAENWPASKLWLPVTGAVVLVMLGVATRRQVGYWADNLTVWTHASEVVKDNWMAENAIGEELLRTSGREAAIPHFRAAAAAEPLALFPHYHIGIYEEESKHPQQALQELQEVLNLTQPYAHQTAAMRSNVLLYMSYAYNELGDYASQQKFMALAAEELHR